MPAFHKSADTHQRVRKAHFDTIVETITQSSQQRKEIWRNATLAEEVRVTFRGYTAS